MGSDQVMGADGCSVIARLWLFFFMWCDKRWSSQRFILNNVWGNCTVQSGRLAWYIAMSRSLYLLLNCFYSLYRRKSRSISPRRNRSRSRTPRHHRSRSPTSRSYKKQRRRSSSSSLHRRSSSSSLGSIEQKSTSEKLKKEEERKRYINWLTNFMFFLSLNYHWVLSALQNYLIFYNGKCYHLLTFVVRVSTLWALTFWTLQLWY